MSTDDPGDEGLGRGTVKCNSCNTPVSILPTIHVVDEVSSNLVDERWCKKSFFDKGESAWEQKERGR